MAHHERARVELGVAARKVLDEMDTRDVSGRQALYDRIPVASELGRGVLRHDVAAQTEDDHVARVDVG
jgi:hypothetical protein